MHMNFSFGGGFAEVSQRPESMGTPEKPGEGDVRWRERLGEATERMGNLIETVLEPYYTSYKERLDHVPAGTHARFEGTPGESKCVPNMESEKGRIAAEKLARYGCNGVDYRDAIPNFSPCAEAVVKIDKMGSERYVSGGNFDQACEKLAEQWNASKCDGRSDWKPSDVEKWRQENNLTIHECSDIKTCMFVDRDIHDVFRHSGGVSECIHRDEKKSRGTFYALFDN